MARRKSRGNPFTKQLSRLVESAAGTALDSFIEIGAGPGKSSKSPGAQRRSTTDWATRGH